MPQTKAEIQKRCDQKRKEKKAEYYQKNKEHKTELHKQYRQTPEGKKSNRITNWKIYGVIHDDFDKLYDIYLNTTECNVCHTVFENTKDRCLDHDHETGLFRQILCRRCNAGDSWKKKSLQV